MYRIFIALLLVVHTFSSKAQLRLPRLFSNNMVLQRNAPIPVWGNAKKNATISVECNGLVATTTVDTASCWMVRIQPMIAGGPYTLKVTELNGNKVLSEKTFENVMIGDVWLASGQSNMELKLSESENGKAEIAGAKNPNIRFFQIPHTIETQPQHDFTSGSWLVCDANTAAGFSAVAYYFGKQIQQEQQVAVGIIQATWGGSPVETWTSKEALMTLPEMHKRIDADGAANINHDSFNQDTLTEKRFFDIAFNSLNGEKLHFTEPSFNDDGWQTIVMPKAFKEIDNHEYQGIVWLRKSVDIPETMSGTDLRLSLGYPDMLYNLYFNGRLICKNVWNAEKRHVYTIPSVLVTKGKNVITLRLAVMWGGGGLNEPADSLYLSAGNQRVSLCGEWRYVKNVETALPTVMNYHKYPSFLFNGMIHPAIPYALKGFLWYQGEENAGYPKSYTTLFPLLINNWRALWKQGDLPFVYVQLPNYMKRKTIPSESDWALLREAQAKSLNLPNTAMAATIDLGQSDDIHPKNKRDVARRLMLAANHCAYSKPGIYSGPMVDVVQIDGSSIRIHFKHVGRGLKIKGNVVLTGFAVAGVDKQFHWAKAVIDGSEIIVESDEVPNPVAVRYAWADNPECNLYNAEGLPAVPFRTDNW